MSQSQRQRTLAEMNHVAEYSSCLFFEGFALDSSEPFSEQSKQLKALHPPREIFSSDSIKRTCPNEIKSIPSKQTWKDSSQLSELMIAAQKLDTHAVQKVLASEEKSLSIRDYKGRTPIFYAMQNQNEDEGCKIINLLVQKFPDLINSQDFEGNTPLIWAIERLSPKYFRQLLLNKANPNFQREPSKNTVLHQIIKQSQGKILTLYLEIARMLLQFEADPFIKNSEGQDCFHFSKHFDFSLESQFEGTLDKEDSSSLSRRKISNTSFISADSDSYLLGEDSQSQEQVESEVIHKTLTKEILQIYENSQKYRAKVAKDIQLIFQDLQRIAISLKLQVYKVGSIETGLWTQKSDINFMYISTDSSQDIEETLKKIQNKIKKNEKFSHAKVYMKKKKQKQKFPKVKIQLVLGKDMRKIDISVFRDYQSGSRYVNYINQSLEYDDYLRPLFFSLHKILTYFEADSTKTGGLQNYFLFLMIKLALFNIANLNNKSLGELFVEVLKIFAKGIIFPRFTINREIVYHAHSIFNAQDPLNPRNKIQKRTNIEKMEQVFKCLFYGSQSLPKTFIIDYFCQLHKIFELTA